MLYNHAIVINWNLGYNKEDTIPRWLVNFHKSLILNSQIRGEKN